MWVAAEHTGRLSFSFHLTPDGSQIEGSALDDAEEIRPETGPSDDDTLVMLPSE